MMFFTDLSTMKPIYLCPHPLFFTLWIDITKDIFIFVFSLLLWWFFKGRRKIILSKKRTYTSYDAYIWTIIYRNLASLQMNVLCGKVKKNKKGKKQNVYKFWDFYIFSSISQFLTSNSSIRLLLLNSSSLWSLVFLEYLKYLSNVAHCSF